nr:hypothetical protein [Tanacetum cinerariifolium]
MSKRVQSKKDNVQVTSEQQNVSTLGRGRGTGYMCLGTGNLEVNVSSKPKNDVIPRRKITITIVDNIFETEDELIIKKDVNEDVDEAFASKTRQKLKGVATVDSVVQSLLDLEKDSKLSIMESMRQEMIARRGKS